MKRIMFLSAIALVMAVTLTGCGKSISQKVGEKVAEKAIEAQTGGKVDIDAQGNDVTIKTEAGESQYSAGGNAKLPENFPSELIAADDAKIIISSTADAGNTVAYTTDSDQGEIFDKYKSQLAEQGWKKEMEIDTGNGKMVNFSKDKENVSITIGENNSNDQQGKTLVNVILVKEEDSPAGQ